ncbi:cytochrome c biogenesis CcdA family protein [Lysinibacillus fusiformis]|uniref:cytochrome c biogenesis CcdA family protein n=1 Tax=Lysinibacillus fusiformis TaxID=28031 RepID=UPI000E334B32|nr:cytochrome c biogenesis protein CcdA [Lysinibacillus fusiformis]AXQ50900.1 cytochrome c biogenesis protein CcdA [Stenotrophomonas rhizophila]KAB0447229.1 cytochrome C biogenesis protein CcdA [Lysinibacillus fusiformis]
MLDQLNLFLVFGAGLLSFLSPCSLPLYPAFLSYVTGVSLNELKENKGILSSHALKNTLLFLVGFSIIFIALGLSTSFVGTFFIQYKDLLRQIGAIIMVFFGLVSIGILKFDFLLSEKKFQFKRRPKGYLGSILIGVGFAAGWTPCTGPILAGVMGLGLTNPEKGLLYMLIYVLGFSVPFLIMSLFIGKLKFFQTKSHLIMSIGGWLMIVMGVLLYFDMMTKIIAWFTPFFGGFTGF